MGHDCLYHPLGDFDIVVPKNEETYSDNELRRYLASNRIGVIPSARDFSVVGLCNAATMMVGAHFNRQASEILGTHVCGDVLVCSLTRLPNAPKPSSSNVLARHNVQN